MNRPLSRLSLALVATAALGCGSAQQLAGALGGLQGGAGGASPVRPNPPRLVSSNVRLAAAPTNQQLAAYYCAQTVNVPAIVSPCRAFGAIPTRADIRFSFAVNLTLENTNQVPLPVAEALMAFTAYPQATGQQNLGALCVSIDQEGAAPRANPTGCRERGGDIRTVEDFGRAAANFLFAVATGQEDPANVRVRTIPPGGRIDVTLTLGLDPETTLGLVRTMSEQAVQGLQRGQAPRFSIPYQFEGTVWVNVERFGRFAVAVPQVSGQFDLQ